MDITEKYRTKEYLIKVGKTVTDLKIQGNVYQVYHYENNVVEFESPMMFEAIAYLSYLQKSKDEMTAAFMEDKVDMPEVH